LQATPLTGGAPQPRYARGGGIAARAALGNFHCHCDKIMAAVLDGHEKGAYRVARRNIRLIVTVAALGIVLLLAMTVIGLGYLAASSQSIGHFAPVGDPINSKRK
jgi:hypothetical protein